MQYLLVCWFVCWFVVACYCWGELGASDAHASTTYRQQYKALHQRTNLLNLRSGLPVLSALGFLHSRCLTQFLKKNYIYINLRSPSCNVTHHAPLPLYIAGVLSANNTTHRQSGIMYRGNISEKYISKVPGYPGEYSVSQCLH